MTSPAHKRLSDCETPCLVLSHSKLARNHAAMNARMERFSVPLRPHIKTAKSIEAFRPALEGANWVTVSTLAEADYALENDIRNILYAVALAPNKIERAAALQAKGADLTVTVDSVEAAEALLARRPELPAVIEIDSDGKRAGVKPESDKALEIARLLACANSFRGLMTHAGGSYACRSAEAIRDMAEQERRAVVDTAAMLKEAGLPCEIVSVGSTPTATFGESFEGVTEVRAGVYMFQDLVMAGLDCCEIDDIALSVLASVIGRQEAKNQLVVDAGWTALSRDRGTADQEVDQGYGLVCDSAGRVLDDMIVVSCNQEHGLVARRDGGAIDFNDFPIGTLLRILPNHACATAAQHSKYLVVDDDQTVMDEWPRINGW